MALPLVINFPDQFFFPHLTGRAIHPRYRQSAADRLLAKLMPRRPAALGDWRRTLEAGGRVILIDTAFDQAMFERLRPWLGQLVIFLWNPVGPQHQFILDHRHAFKVYSHDRGDCCRYGLAFNTTFYHRIEGLTPHPQPHDVTFIGTLKGRLDTIQSLYEQLGSLSCHFYLRARSADRHLLAGSTLPIHQAAMPYPQYLRHVLASRAILDVLQAGQQSLTLRAMESLFYERKLITTYEGIVQEDFYDPRNVHVIHDIGRVDLPALRAFLAEPYHPVDPAIVAGYHFDAWIRRFA